VGLIKRFHHRVVMLQRGQLIHDPKVAGEVWR
jgi:hypothetical protein